MATNPIWDDDVTQHAHNFYLVYLLSGKDLDLDVGGPSKLVEELDTTELIEEILNRCELTNGLQLVPQHTLTLLRLVLNKEMLHRFYARFDGN